MSKSKIFLGSAIFSSLTLLAACGGGGGGSSNGFVVPAISHTPISINASNEPAITQAGFDATTGSAELGSQVPFSPVSPVNTADSSTQISPNAYQLIKRIVTDNIKNDGNLNKNLAGVAFEDSSSCLVGGTESTVGDIAAPNSNSLSIGDYATTTYSNCDDGYGEILNGSVKITFNSSLSLPVSSTNIALDMTVNFSNFRSTQEGYGTVTLNGEFDVSMTLTSTDFAFSMAGDSLYIVDPESSTHLINFDISFSTDSATSGLIIDSSFTVANSALDGQLTIDSYFVFTSGSSYPSSGSLSIAGNNSQIDLQVVGDGTVNVTLTINNMVEAGYPKNLTWAELGVEITNFLA